MVRDLTVYSQGPTRQQGCQPEHRRYPSKRYQGPFLYITPLIADKKALNRPKDQTGFIKQERIKKIPRRARLPLKNFKYRL